MLNQIVNRLQGQVRIRVETPFPERVLNLCGARNLAFWDMEWESETAFTCRLNRRDYYALRRAVKQLDCRLTVVRKEGVPFFLGRFRRRHALLAGLTLCSALLFFGSFFIWDFTVEGNQRVTDEEIRNHVLLEIPELLWITVNVSGCRAYVEVRERVEAPEPVDEREPTNVVARRDGLILDIQAMDGVRCVLPGTSVEAGELLISGVEDTGTFGTRFTAGLGRVEDTASRIARGASRATGQREAAERVLLCLEVLAERGLIDLETGPQGVAVSLRQVERKVDLEACPILGRLRRAIRGGSAEA